MLAVLDCNNFFASCERVFRPDLQNKPVAVLSNNDGCFVARSNEVKALGIPMGAPLFEYQTLVKQHNINLFSANFTLYGDLSDRIMLILNEELPHVEVYSIDEAFFSLDGIPNPVEYSKHLCEKIYQWVGVPVSIGIAPNKTLSKLANEWAKHHPEANGVYLLNPKNPKSTNTILKQIPIIDIWGVGRQLSKMLNRYGIYTAYDLKNANSKFLKQQSSINLQRTVEELNGAVCYPLQQSLNRTKSISTTRTFGIPKETKEGLRKALAAYTSRAAEKLRHEHLLAERISIFVRTNRFNAEQYYSRTVEATFPTPTDYTPQIIATVNELLDQIFKATKQYKQAGVTLHHLVPNTHRQQNFFYTPYVSHSKQTKLMHTMDGINTRWGSDTLRSAAMGTKQLWSNKDTQRSPRYTTSWNELLTLR